MSCKTTAYSDKYSIKNNQHNFKKYIDHNYSTFYRHHCYLTHCNSSSVWNNVLAESSLSKVLWLKTIRSIGPQQHVTLLLNSWVKLPLNSDVSMCNKNLNTPSTICKKYMSLPLRKANLTTHGDNTKMTRIFE